MTEEATPEATDLPEVPEVTEELPVDDDWGLSAITELADNPPADLPEEPVEVDDLPEDTAIEEEPEVAEDTNAPKKGTVAYRINQINEKNEAERQALKSEYEAKMAAMEAKLDNVLAGQDYLKPDATPATIDEKLAEAAKEYGDSEFDIDEFDTLAEKKAMLLSYNNGIAQAKATEQAKQGQMQQQINGVKDTYINAVTQLKDTNADLANNLANAYNAAIQSDALAIERRYGSQVTPEQARYHAEQGLLKEAMGAENPVMYIAQYGAKLLPATAPLPKEQKAATINHKNREEVKNRAGKPAIDPMPMTKRQKAVNEKFDSLDF